jgi:molecular chaperone GrpE (heat shock protein)
MELAEIVKALHSSRVKIKEWYQSETGVLWVLYLQHSLNEAKEQLLYNRHLTEAERVKAFAEIDVLEDILNLPDTLNRYKEAVTTEPPKDVSRSQAEVMQQIHGV